MKKGFVSMAVVYSFLIVFLVLMASFLTTYINKNKFDNKLVDTTKNSLNEKYQEYLINGETEQYVYWNANTVVSTEFAPNEKPENASESVEDLGCEDIGTFIRTKIVDGEASGHELCVSYDSKISCIEKSYWDTDGATTMTKLSNNMQESLQTTSYTCTNNTSYINCCINGVCTYVYNYATSTVVDTHTDIICNLDANGKAKCWFD